jgi:hypothetical protein
MVMSFHIIFVAVFLSQMADFRTTRATPCDIPVVDEAYFVAWQVTGRHIVMFDRHASQG